MTPSQMPFRAVLFPHRSLSRPGFVVLMVLLGAVCGFGAARALAIGAWPVSVFVALDVLLVWGAFRLSYRSGRQFEEVSVTPHEILIRQVAPSGRATEHRFPPHGTRLHVTRGDEDEGVTRLALAAPGRSLVIGAFLNPGDRATFADAFAAALARARRG